MKIDHPTEDMIGALRRLWQQAFGDDDAFLDAFFATGFSPKRCRCVIENAEPVAALYWFDCECDGAKLAYIYAVATDKAHCHRGLCRQLMLDTHALLKEQGYDGALLVPGATSLAGVYSPLGYRYCTQIREFFCTAAPEMAVLRQIEAAEYARLRKAMLPCGAVVQEGDGLAFLATQTHFYAGHHLLLAARRDGDTLFAAELLGDAAAAPEILCALGAAHGRFRTAGEGRNFAMYCPFTAVPAPKYLAFAFD